MNEDFIAVDGIFSDGYGFIPKKLMRDKRLTSESKAIYAYLSSFAGAGMTSYPSVSLMMSELSMSKDRFYKHRKLLIDFGYVEIVQKKDKENQFSKNIYLIKTRLPSTCFKDTGKPYTGNEDTENKDTNSNSSNSNSLNSISTKEGEANASLSSGDDAPKKINLKEQVDLVVDAWNEIAPQAGLQEVVAITTGSNRDRQLRARLKQFKAEGFIRAIQLIEASLFLQGHNDRGWVITFDWFIRPSNFSKVLEGNYNGERRGVQNGITTNTGGNVPHNIRVQQELQNRAQRARDSGVLDNFDGPL